MHEVAFVFVARPPSFPPPNWTNKKLDHPIPCPLPACLDHPTCCTQCNDEPQSSPLPLRRTNPVHKALLPTEDTSRVTAPCATQQAPLRRTNPVHKGLFPTEDTSRVTAPCAAQ